MSTAARVVVHPLIQHNLSLMRRKETPSPEFRRLLREIGMLFAFETLRDLPTRLVDIVTPLAPMKAPMIVEDDLCFVSILRAGNGLLDGMLDVAPFARVGHIGLYRDPKTLTPVEYYCKLPPDIARRNVYVLDPMLATGNSAVAAISRIKELKPRALTFVCLLAAPEGVAVLHEAHPEVPIFTAALDERLDDHGYIVPGLGDAGDRIFGTK